MSGNLRDHLQAIYTAHGELTADLVVDEASDPNHPLHNRFNWDDADAAHKHRLDQARGLIRLVRVTYRDSAGDQKNVRSFHSFTRPTGKTSYIPVEEVTESAMMTRILLADMRRDWHALKRRYEHFAEFADMIRGDMENAA